MSDHESLQSHLDKAAQAEKKNREITEKPSLVWLVSFTDVMALMLTFFVLLFSMSTPKEDAWSEFVVTLGSEFKTEYGGPKEAGIHANEEMDSLNLNRGLDMGYLSALLHRMLGDDEDFKDVNIIKYNNYVVISLPSDLLFEAGSAKLQDRSYKLLKKLTGVLKHIKNIIEIQGHSDPDPVTRGVYHSNWGLSLARGFSVAQFIKGQGYKKDIMMRGMSDQVYDTLPASISKETRYKKSRRVDIIVRYYQPNSLWSF